MIPIESDQGPGAKRPRQSRPQCRGTSGSQSVGSLLNLEEPGVQESGGDCHLQWALSRAGWFCPHPHIPVLKS